MPWPVGYTGTQDDDQTRAIDFVHIEPSIREGVHLVSSIYGPEASKPLNRFPPVNKVLPSISGSPKIPAVLTCDYGQWDASPSASFAYQWMADGADIPGANSQSWTSTVEYDDTDITCEVRAYNTQGEDYVLSSNSIHISLVEPIEIRELEYHVMTGMESPKALTALNEKDVIVTGLGALKASTIVRSVAYYFTGRSADKREDINAMFTAAIQGMPQELRVSMKAPSIVVINWPEGEPLIEGVSQAIPIKNYEAEIGMLGWEVFGAAEYTTRNNGGGYENNYCWWGGANVDANQQNIPYSYMWQDVPLYDVWWDDIDANLCFIDISWFQTSDNWLDQANMKVEYLSAGKAIIGSDGGPGLQSSRDGIWFSRDFSDAIPSGTRYIRVYIEFNLMSGTDNNAYVDSVKGMIRKGDALTDRSYGPNFDMWRLYFNRANTYSGVSLSELEFRNVSGGADLATGGLEISGSEGNSGLTMYAFDDLRDGNYWSGELNGVVNGTSWIGYDMGVDSQVRPQELSITARSGTYSKEMGLDFYLQGSNDGIRWTNVQHYEAVPVFEDAEQRQFEVSYGNFDFWFQTSLEGQSGYSIGSGSAEYRPTKGNIWRARTRLTITEIASYFADLTFVNPVQVGIFKVGFGSGYPFNEGYAISEVQSYALTTPAEAGWVTQKLSEDFVVEVGEFFCVFHADMDVTSGYGKTARFSNLGSEDGLYNVFNGNLLTYIGSWGSTGIPVKGTTNYNLTTYRYAADFKGFIF